MAVKSTKKHKKIWFSIITPKEFGDYVVGETLTAEPQNLIGRNVRVNLMSVLNDPKKQNIQLTFKIKSVRDKNAVTEIISYELLPSYAKRLVRKGRNKIEDSFVVETKDKTKIRVKPVMVTRTKTQRSKQTRVRNIAREFITERAKAQDITEIIHEVVSTKLQRELRDHIKKIYPLAMLEFKMIKKL